MNIAADLSNIFLYHFRVTIAADHILLLKGVFHIGPGVFYHFEEPEITPGMGSLRGGYCPDKMVYLK